MLTEEVAELRAYRNTQTVVSEWVVCGPDGEPRSRKWWERQFEAIRAAAGVAPATGKCLRHTAATYLTIDVRDTRAVSLSLGHHNPGYTLAKYGTDTREGAEALLDAMADLGAETGPESRSARGIRADREPHSL